MGVLPTQKARRTTHDWRARHTPEHIVIQLEQRFCTAICSRQWGQVESLMTPDSFLVMIGDTGQLVTLSRTKWLAAMRSGRVMSLRIADMIVRAQRNCAVAALVLCEDTHLPATSLVVTDLWVKAPGWLLAERHTTKRVS